MSPSQLLLLLLAQRTILELMKHTQGSKSIFLATAWIEFQYLSA